MADRDDAIGIDFRRNADDATGFFGSERDEGNLRRFFGYVAALGDEAKGRRSFEFRQFDSAGAQRERGGVFAEVAVIPNEFDNLGVKLGRERNVGGGKCGAHFHAQDFGTAIQDEVAIGGV